MKKARKALLIGALTVTAIAGAIASANRVSTTRYYWSNDNNTGTVLSGSFTDDCEIGGDGCRADTPVGERQLFANPDGTDPLQKP